MGWLLEQLPESNLGDTMVHIAWDNGQRTSVSLKRLRNDENEGRIEGALPIAFELSRSFDLAHKFGGTRLFVEGVDSAVWTFCDSIARHLRAWQPRPEGMDQPKTVEEMAESPEREVIREANIPGGRVRIFDDGSIELETPASKTWYRSFTELERSLRARDGLKTHQQSDSADGNGGDTSAVPAPTATSTDASPGQQATSTNIIS